MDEQPPRMSVILMVDRQRRRGERCLASILEQSIVDRLEVILVDFGGRDFRPLRGSDHPRVRMIRRPRGTPYGSAKAEGVMLARAPVVAFAEEHCRMLPGWAEALVAAHERPVVGVGGEAHNATPGRGLTDFVALMASGPWYPPARRGEATTIPGNNSSYKREVLTRYEGALPVLLRNEFLFQQILRDDGATFVVEPAAKYLHAFEDSIRNYCYTVHLFGRVYGATQAELHRWSRRRRALSAARECIRLLIPPVRSVVRLAKLAPEKRGVLLRRAPLVLASHWCSTVGRLIGVLHGLDGADVRLLDYDLNACRREAPQRAARTSSTPAGLSSELRSPGSAPR